MLKKVRVSFSLRLQFKHWLGAVGMSRIQSATIMNQIRPNNHTRVAISACRKWLTAKPTISGIAMESSRMRDCGTFDGLIA